MEIFVSLLAVGVAFTCLGLIVKSDVLEMLGKRKVAAIDHRPTDPESAVSKNH